MLGVNLLALLNNISSWWHMVGVLIIVVVLIVVPDHHQSAAFVFGQTINNSGFDGAPFWLVFGLGLLMAQYTITGYDASAHMSEETRLASRSAAWGMVMSVVVSVVFGFILLVAVTFAVPDVQGTLDAVANAVVYIWTTSLGDTWAEILLVIAVVAQFFCGTASVTSASRMMFAFSRDGAVPGSRIWRKVSARRVPVNAVIAIVVLAWALMLPTLLNAAIGYLVGTSIAVIGLYIAFAIPIYLRIRAGSRFEHGAWSLGDHYKWISPLAVIWIVAHLHPVPAPGVPQGDPGTGLRLDRGQLRAAHGGRRADPVRRLVPPLGPQVVHRAGPRGGHRGGAGEHRTADGALMPSRRGMLTLEQLTAAVEDGSVDTVLVAFTDMQGRLQGKRCAADYFLDEVAPHAAEACNYLLAVDVEMNTVGGYAMSSWERGYGDFVLRPDLTTLRMVPWHEATALVLCDAEWGDGSPVVASPRQILRRQLDRLAERGLVADVGTELEFLLFADSFDDGVAEGLPRPAARQPLQRRLLDAGHRPRRAGAAPHPQRDGGRRDGGRVGEGRVQPRPARDRLPLHRRAHHLRQPLDLQDRRQGDRRPGRDGADVHGEVRRARGQLLPHPHLAARATSEATCSPATARTASRRCSRTSSPANRPACAS